MTDRPAAYAVDPAELERFAAEHDRDAAAVRAWAAADQDFAERYLATHGTVNYGTYLRLRDYHLGRLAAGTAYADHHAATAAALRTTRDVTVGTDADNGADFGAQQR